MVGIGVSGFVASILTPFTMKLMLADATLDLTLRVMSEFTVMVQVYPLSPDSLIGVPKFAVVGVLAANVASRSRS